jgi:hypothetical protein
MRAIEAFAKSAGFTIVGEYYDKAVSGADRVDQRPGFREMLQRLASNGAKTIVVESPIALRVISPCSCRTRHAWNWDRHHPASAPDFFTEDTPQRFSCASTWGHRSI